MTDQNAYEMLWDCQYCGARKLLGLTHRFCPNCGGPQDTKARYFPSDQDKILVKDHRYAGVDRTCPSCREANGSAAKHCRHCGGPLEGAVAVQTRAEHVHAEGAFQGDSAQAAQKEWSPGGASKPTNGVQNPPARAGSRKGWLGILVGVGCLTALLGIGLIIAVMLLWTRDTTVQVVEHHWQRSVEIERYARGRDQAWCDSMPAGAREVSRTKAERSSEKVKVGEDCKTRKKDRGDGTFVETRECSPRYDSKPVYADRCTYEVMRWEKVRTESAEGRSLQDTPRWPSTGIVFRGACEGCQREGKREEKYLVYFSEPGTSARPYCGYSESEWRTFPMGKRYKAVYRKLTGTIDCGSLQPAP